MKNYRVIFKWTGSIFEETTIVYSVNNRQQAIQAVKDHYGTKAKIISARAI